MGRGGAESTARSALVAPRTSSAATERHLRATASRARGLIAPPCGVVDGQGEELRSLRFGAPVPASSSSRAWRQSNPPNDLHRRIDDDVCRRHAATGVRAHHRGRRAIDEDRRPSSSRRSCRPSSDGHGDDDIGTHAGRRRRARCSSAHHRRVPTILSRRGKDSGRDMVARMAVGRGPLSSTRARPQVDGDHRTASAANRSRERSVEPAMREHQIHCWPLLSAGERDAATQLQLDVRRTHVLLPTNTLVAVAARTARPNRSASMLRAPADMPAAYARQ